MKRLPPIRARSLGEEVAKILRERILGGEYRSGERLIETTLADQLMLSRGPVREALLILRTEGLVTDEPHRATRVTNLSRDDLREIFDLRVAVEGRAAQTIAVSEKAEIGELRAVLTLLRSAVERGDTDTMIDRDIEFHATLCRLSGNKRLYQVFLQHVPVLETVFRLNKTALRSALPEMPDRHDAIVESIEMGDPKAALRAIELHMAVSEELFAQALEGDRQHPGQL